MEHAESWADLPGPVLMGIARWLPATARAHAYRVNAHWRRALAASFEELFIGPRPPAALSGAPEGAWAGYQPLPRRPLGRVFPYATDVQLVVSSSRDTAAEHPEIPVRMAGQLTLLPSLSRLRVHELHEIEGMYGMEAASAWDVLALALPALAGRLRLLHVSHAFWTSYEPFGQLRLLTGLTELRLMNVPLETAAEVEVLVGLTQLRVLEFGICYDGSEETHGVPAALAQLSRLCSVHELALPMWRKTFGGQAHPLAPALSRALAGLPALASLEVDGRFGSLAVVSTLSGLTRLCAAAPLAEAGWKAIAQLPGLKVVTSLTPLWEPPQRTHLSVGGNLSLLSCRATLTALDTFVPAPGCLAALSHLSALQQLALRGYDLGRSAGGMLVLDDQPLLLAVLEGLPPSLTSFVSNSLLYINGELLALLARRCRRLRELGLLGYVEPGAAWSAHLARMPALRSLRVRHRRPGADTGGAGAGAPQRTPLWGVDREALGALPALHIDSLPPGLRSLQLREVLLGCVAGTAASGEEMHWQAGGEGGGGGAPSLWDVSMHPSSLDAFIQQTALQLAMQSVREDSSAAASPSVLGAAVGSPPSNGDGFSADVPLPALARDAAAGASAGSLHGAASPLGGLKRPSSRDGPAPQPGDGGGSGSAGWGIKRTRSGILAAPSESSGSCGWGAPSTPPGALPLPGGAAAAPQPWNAHMPALASSSEQQAPLPALHVLELSVCGVVVPALARLAAAAGGALTALRITGCAYLGPPLDGARSMPLQPQRSAGSRGAACDWFMLCGAQLGRLPFEWGGLETLALSLAPADVGCGVLPLPPARALPHLRELQVQSFGGPEAWQGRAFEQLVAALRQLPRLRQLNMLGGAACLGHEQQERLLAVLPYCRMHIH